MYRDLVSPPHPDTEYGAYMAESNKMYEKAIDSFPAPDPPDECVLNFFCINNLMST